MQVKLRQNWFGPNGQTFPRSNEGWTEVPDEYRAFLPSTAIVRQEAVSQEEQPVEPGSVEPGALARDLDEERAREEAVAARVKALTEKRNRKE